MNIKYGSTVRPGWAPRELLGRVVNRGSKKQKGAGGGLARLWRNMRGDLAGALVLRLHRGMFARPIWKSPTICDPCGLDHRPPSGSEYMSSGITMLRNWGL
jgi:hypothetical protein